MWITLRTWPCRCQLVVFLALREAVVKVWPKFQVFLFVADKNRNIKESTVLILSHPSCYREKHWKALSLCYNAFVSFIRRRPPPLSGQSFVISLPPKCSVFAFWKLSKSTNKPRHFLQALLVKLLPELPKARIMILFILYSPTPYLRTNATWADFSRRRRCCCCCSLHCCWFVHFYWIPLWFCRSAFLYATLNHK